MPEDTWLAVYGGNATCCDEEQWNYLATRALSGMQLCRSVVEATVPKLIAFDVGLYGLVAEQAIGMAKSLALQVFVSGVVDANRGITFDKIAKDAQAAVGEGQHPSLHHYVKAAIVSGQGGLKEAVELRDARRIERQARHRVLKSQIAEVAEKAVEAGKAMAFASGEDAERARDEFLRIAAEKDRLQEELEELTRRKVVKRETPAPDPSPAPGQKRVAFSHVEEEGVKKRKL